MSKFNLKTLRAVIYIYRAYIPNPGKTYVAGQFVVLENGFKIKNLSFIQHVVSDFQNKLYEPYQRATDATVCFRYTAPVFVIDIDVLNCIYQAMNLIDTNVPAVGFDPMTSLL